MNLTSVTPLRYPIIIGRTSLAACWFGPKEPALKQLPNIPRGRTPDETMGGESIGSSGFEHLAVVNPARTPIRPVPPIHSPDANGHVCAPRTATTGAKLSMHSGPTIT